jgi:hypothetical protein
MGLYLGSATIDHTPHIPGLTSPPLAKSGEIRSHLDFHDAQRCTLPDGAAGLRCRVADWETK